MLIKWFRRNLLLTHFLLLALIASLATIIWYSGEWFFGGSRETFGALNSYIFIWVSIAIASVAALNSMLSSSIAIDAQRPFLYIADSIKVKQVGKYITLEFNIKNSGSLPAEDVQTDITFFHEDEEIKEKNQSSKYKPPIVEPTFSILFPNSDYHQGYILDLNQENDLELWNNIMNGKTKCRVQITYKGLGRKHETIQTEKLAKREWAEGILTIPIPPQKWT